MKYQTRTNKKLIEENALLKQRIQELEQSELERKKVEEALRESEETLKLITDNMSDMIRLIDLQGTNLYVSPSHLTVLGYNPGDKDGKFTLDFIHPEDIENVSKVFFEGLAKTQPERVECRVKHANGHYVWIEVVGDFIRNDKGEVTSIVMTSRDITERRQTEEKLRESEELSNISLENAPDGIYMNDLEGTFLYGNRKCEEITGYRREEVIGKNFIELNLLPENSLNKAAQLLQANMEGKSTGPDEIELIRKGGRIIPIEINTNVVQRMGQRVALATVRDITERKRAEEALRRSEQLYRTFLESTMDMVLLKDDELRHIMVNKPLLDFMGKEENEIIGKTDAELLPQSIAQVCRQTDMEVIQSGAIVKTEESMHDGIYETRKFPVALGDGKIGVGGYIRDITERKRIENEIQRNYDTQGALNILLRLSLENIPFDEILEQALDLVLSIPWLALEAKGAIFLIEHEPDVLVMKAQNNLEEPIRMLCARVPFGKCLCGRAASMQKTQFSDHIDERHEISYEGMMSHGHYCVPILSDGRTIGVITLYHACPVNC